MVLGLQAWAPGPLVKAIYAAELHGEAQTQPIPCMPRLGGKPYSEAPSLSPELGLCWYQAFLDVGIRDQAPPCVPGLP